MGTPDSDRLRSLLYQAALAGLLPQKLDTVSKADYRQLLTWLAALPKAADPLLAIHRINRVVAPRPAGDKQSLTVFVVGHRREQLDTIGDAPHVRKVYLPDLERDNRLAENRIYRSDLLLACESDYLGLASASWNTKYDGQTCWNGRYWPHCLPVERLDELALSPSVVWAAAVTDDRRWSYGLDRIFHGVHRLTGEIIKRFGLRHRYRVGPLANNFIAHRSVVRSLTHFMRAAIEYLDSKYGPIWPICPDRTGQFANRLPAFMGEALSILWFAQQTDLRIRQIPRPAPELTP